MKNFGKYLLLVLALLSIGGASGYGNTLPDIREEQPFSTQDLKAAGSLMWAYRENPFQDVHDLTENLFFGSISVIPDNFSNFGNLSADSLRVEYERDLRKILFQQIFPKHFFL